MSGRASAEYWRKYRQRNKQSFNRKARERHHKRLETEPGYREAVREAGRRDYQANAESRRESQRQYRARNPEKIKARRLLGFAIKAGKIVRQPCADCGATERVHGHHHDYSKPLDVVWLCPPCHGKRHQLGAEQAGGVQ